MSAFSFTAPFISPEQEEEEYASCSEGARAEILNDLYGRDWETSQKEDDRRAEASSSASIGLFQEALESIPLHEKAEYSEAMERVPHLVAEESPPESFLRAARFDPWAAASRMVAYWKFRKELFGPHRAYMPMTLEGAMRDDRHVFLLGASAILPPDTAGRSVIFFNRIACTRAVAPREVFLRCLFYVGQVASEAIVAPHRGLVILYNARGLDLYRHFDRIMMKKIAQLPTVLPTTLRSCHVVTGSEQSVVSLILPVMKQIAGLEQRHRLRLHAGSDLEIIQRLSDYGLAPESIPSIFGGTWKQSDFSKWAESRHKLETSRHKRRIDR